MKKNILYIFVLFCSLAFSQENLSELLKKYNSESIPYITVEDLTKQQNAIILDSRELPEYKVSHLKNAICVGYDNFNLRKTTKQLKDKQQTIVVYCSLGIRSEDIAEKLKKAGWVVQPNKKMNLNAAKGVAVLGVVEVDFTNFVDHLAHQCTGLHIVVGIFKLKTK